jgi:predicted nucleic acid-binding protein
MVFVDTSAWFAFFLPVDVNHHRIARFVESNSQPLITTDYCIDETLTLLLARGETQRAIHAGRAFFQDGLARIHFVAEDQVCQAWIQFQQRAHARWSFTDCTSKIVIDALRIRTAAALDDHFRQFGNLIVMP